MEPSGMKNTNAVQTRARNDMNMSKTAGECTSNRSLEFETCRSSREDNPLSLSSYVGTVVFSFLTFLRWFLGILFLGPAQQVWRTFDHNFISSRNVSCQNSKTSRVFVIDNVLSCDKLLQSYRSQYPFKLNFLGLDCEWVNRKGQTNAPVALLQIATPLSDCFLIRLCKMDGHLPQSVREILEDKNILKFGVGIKDDAKRLSGMFGIDVLGCVDLRHVIQRCRMENSVQPRNQKTSLDALAKRILGVTMDKNWRIRCSNWEAEQFDRRQIEYAMNDALVASHIFLRLAKSKTEEREMLKTACISEDSIYVEKEVSENSEPQLSQCNVDGNFPDSTKNLSGDDITSGSEIHDLTSIEEPNLGHPNEDSICVEKEASIYSESWLSPCKVDSNLRAVKCPASSEIHDSISTEEEHNLAHPSEATNNMESEVIDSNMPNSTKNLSADDISNGSEIHDSISIEEEPNLARPSEATYNVESEVTEDQKKCKENSGQEDLHNVSMVNKRESCSGNQGNDSKICQKKFQNSEDFNRGFAFDLDFDVYNVIADLNKWESGHDRDGGYFFREEVIDLLQDSFFCQRASSLCKGVVDLAFKDKKRAVKAKEKRKKKEDPREISDSDRKPYKRGTIRKSPLYMNCMLAAPDGSRLCTLDRKKADWYIDKGIGHLTCLDPYTVQLKFEPSGRPGSEDSYYLNFKDNVCVVCGSDQSYMRKNIVPHDYRRYFPLVMKDHHSHDILLMCPECHCLSSSYDDKLRKELANKYNAPLGNATAARLIENPDLKKVKSAAKALNYAGNKLPQDRHQQLSLLVQKYFNASILTPEMITEAATMETRKENSNFVSHGQEVVKKLREEGKLLEFEKIWRQHFLDTMRPRYLPPLWSVDHRHDGLKEKLDDFNEN